MADATERPGGEGAPGLRLPWSRSDRPVPRRIVRPLQEFLHTEASGGVLLLIAAAGALLWANVDAGSYERVWGTTFSVGLGRWSITEDLRHWVNDALMAIFFFVVGLEIKRELVSGELRHPRAAALPVAAAVGGMVLPAAIYLALAAGGEGSRGWGIPMATDIAFALGVLAVAGRGAGPGVKLFLLTLAIVDDIGAILVIAIFYTGSVSMTSFAVAAMLLALMVGLRRLGVRAGAAYLALAVGVWLAVFESGVHATIAGVALAFVTPAAAFQRPRAVSDEARRVADLTADHPWPPDVDAPEWLRLATLSREAVSPLARLERALHPWTSFLIVPLFALANAGVRIDGASLEHGAAWRVAAGVVAGLAIGKVCGITLGAWAASRLGATLPEGTSWSQLGGVGMLGGIGFTVSLFVATLAFPSGELLDAAKSGILAGSAISGVAGSLVLARHRGPAGGEASRADASGR